MGVMILQTNLGDRGFARQPPADPHRRIADRALLRHWLDELVPLIFPELRAAAAVLLPIVWLAVLSLGTELGSL